MKKFAFLTILFAAIVIFSGCESSVDNSITLKNMSQGKIVFTFRAQEIEVQSGQTVTIKDIPRGTFAYSTVYEIPANTTSFAEEGDLASDLTIKAGTDILIVYTSTFIENTYTIYATMSSSDGTGDGLLDSE